MRVYLTEYGAGADLAKRIDNWCGKRGYVWYNSKSIDLD
jgi:hypothetical protein